MAVVRVERKALRTALGQKVGNSVCHQGEERHLGAGLQPNNPILCLRLSRRQELRKGSRAIDQDRVVVEVLCRERAIQCNANPLRNELCLGSSGEVVFKCGAPFQCLVADKVIDVSGAPSPNVASHFTIVRSDETLNALDDASAIEAVKDRITLGLNAVAKGYEDCVLGVRRVLRCHWNECIEIRRKAACDPIVPWIRL